MLTRVRRSRDGAAVSRQQRWASYHKHIWSGWPAIAERSDAEASLLKLTEWPTVIPCSRPGGTFLISSFMEIVIYYYCARKSTTPYSKIVQVGARKSRGWVHENRAGITGWEFSKSSKRPTYRWKLLVWYVRVMLQWHNRRQHLRRSRHLIRSENWSSPSPAFIWKYRPFSALAEDWQPYTSFLWKFGGWSLSLAILRTK